LFPRRFVQGLPNKDKYGVLALFPTKTNQLFPFSQQTGKCCSCFPTKTNDLFPGRFVQGFPNKDKLAQKLNKMEKLVPVSQQNVQNVQNGIPCSWNPTKLTDV